MHSQPVPCLWHYTDSAGVLGILSLQQLWFTDMRFLNDSQEFVHVCKIISKTIESQGAAYKSKWVQAGFSESAFDGMIAKFARDVLISDEIYRWISEYGQPYILSFTERRDALSQWTSYGDGQYSIGFDYAKLTSLLGLSAVKIIYSCSETFILPDVGNLKTFLTQYAHDPFPGGQVSPTLMGEGLRHILSGTTYGNLFFEHKHHSFHTECEWRCVIRSQSLKDLAFRTSGRYAVPFLKRGVQAQNCFLTDAITEIVCGPGIDLRRARVSIDQILRKQNRPNIPVTPSTVPYRST